MKKDSKFHSEALTFDDVLLTPSYSEVIPSEANVQTKLTKNIALNIPLVSASMDTVTESKLAIAIALKGGIGIVHKNMTISEQSEEIRRVKRSQSGMIKDPITMGKDSSVRDAYNEMFGYEAWSTDWQASSEAIELWGNLAQKTRFRPELSTKLQ